MSRWRDACFETRRAFGSGVRLSLFPPKIVYNNCTICILQHVLITIVATEEPISQIPLSR